jgi:hypothetical protein
MCYNLTSLRLTCLLEYTWCSLKIYWKGKWTWMTTRLPLHSGSSIFNSKFILVLSLPLCSYLIFWWGNGVKGPKMIPFWCFMPKGEKLRAKATGSANHLWISKIVELEFVFCTNDSYCKIWSLMGVNFDYGKKVEFLAVDQFYSWNISWFSQTSVFDLEIGKRIWFAKTNQVVAKSDPNMPNLK